MRLISVRTGWMTALSLVLAALLLGGCVAAKPKVEEPVDQGLLEDARASYEAGDYDQSLALYGQSINQGETVAARLGAGVVMMAMQRPEAALREFTRVVVLAPGLAVGHADRGLALAALGRGKAAGEAFDEALRLDPAAAVALNGKGCLFLDDGQVEEALVHFSSALKSDPNNPDIHYNRALGFHLVGLDADAEDELDAALRLRPGDARFLAMRGVVRLGRGDAEAALGDLDEAVEIDSENPDHYYNRGLAQQELMNYEAAVADYTRAMVRAPAQAVYYINRGEARMLDGDKLGGCEDLARACELGRCERQKSAEAAGLCKD